MAAGVTGAMLLEELQPNYAWAQQMAPDDPAIETMVASYESANSHGTTSGLMARTSGVTGALPTILVEHENRGLDPYIEDAVRGEGRVFGLWSRWVVAFGRISGDG